ncbi:MAG: NADH-quinone oxidoreductase subunit M [Thermoleophilaceae bacterium]
MVDVSLSVLIFLPLAAALVGALAPPRVGRWVAVGGSVVALAYVLVILEDFSRASAALQFTTDVAWISELGVRYSLGVDGLNLFLILLTALLWVPAMVWAALRVADRPRLFMFHMALAETAVLGAFCAQDLALFVVFFDLMLVPFYFLIGGWGQGERVAATTKFVIYTLVGSLLMLAGAVALGVLTASETGNELTFSIRELAQSPLPAGTQNWIFLLFAAAFLVKAPAFPLHGWVVDTYRATPIPVLVVLSAVLSKVGVYAFLRIVLPVMPDASATFQEPMLVVAVISILYGSVLAFSQSEPRLVVAYSSIAQLGFILLGIFALDELGAQGALMQMVNHGLVVAALFFIIAALTARAAGSPSLEQMGGMALRAPVLAALFLIVALATLAMPGSPNFVGEILILFGALEEQLVYALVASVGVALAAVYGIRLLQRSMHNRVGPSVEGGDLGRLDLGVIAPLAAVIVALGVYPQLILDRTEAATTAKVTAAAESAGQGGRDRPAIEAPGGPIFEEPGADPRTELDGGESHAEVSEGR